MHDTAVTSNQVPFYLTKMSSSSNGIEKAKLAYQACVELRGPTCTPLAFAIENVKSFLQDNSKLEPQKKKDMRQSLVEALVQPCDKVLTTSAAAKTEDRESTIRALQVQVLLRLQFWASLGDAFVCHYKKLKLSKKKKRRQTKKQDKSTKEDPSQPLFFDVCDLLSMLAMKLPQNVPFASFLSDCLDPVSYTHLTLPTICSV